jgi:hypothetical protein
MDKNNKYISNIKNIWLNTTDVPTSAITNNRRFFTFFDLPLIQIKKQSFLRVNSLTLSGAGSLTAIDHNWTIKLHNLNYNGGAYFNSDKIAEPTILCFNYDTKNSVQNGLFSLELVPQDLNTLTLEIFNEAGEGAIKNTYPFNIHLNLIIEEIDE